MLEVLRELDILRRKLVRFDVEPLGTAWARHNRELDFYSTEAQKAYEAGDKDYRNYAEIVVSLSSVWQPPRMHSLLLRGRLGISLGAW